MVVFMVDFVLKIKDFLSITFAHPQIVVTLLAILPIVEARLAIPMAFSYGFAWYESLFYGFLGSTLIAPVLLLFLMPFIKWLSSTKIFKKVGLVLYDKMEGKSKKINDKASELKKFFAIVVFVAVPLPLTGVWSGCAVASILKMKYFKALGAVALGNLIASTIITVVCVPLSSSLIYSIIIAIAVIAAIIMIILLIKIFTYKKKPNINEAK